MTKVIAEIGINHNGSVAIAKRLIHSAANAGCWGVKFQYRDITDFYGSENEIGDEILISELKRVNLTIEDYIELIDCSRSQGLKVGVSFFRKNDITEFITRTGELDFIKIPSVEFLNIPLIKSAVDTGMTVMASTGAHDSKDLQKFKKYFPNSDITLFHCISNYPVITGNQQLNYIDELKTVNNDNVGYSSHDRDYEMVFMALMKGIRYLERHITLDKDDNGLDHSCSSTPNEFERICNYCKSLQGILGGKKRFINQGEVINKQNLGSCAYMKKGLNAGDVVTMDDVNFSTPRLGLGIDELGGMENMTLKQSIQQGEPLYDVHFMDEPDPLEIEKITMANDMNLGIPVRLHDYAFMSTMYPINCFELHLSYSEILYQHDKLIQLADSFSNKEKISIHLPDYIPGNLLMDPISVNKEQARTSQQIVEKLCFFAQHINQVTGNAVPVVGSFSQMSGRDERVFYRDLHCYLLGVEKQTGVIISPQWLPGIAWYFGGADCIRGFNNTIAIEMIKELDMKICLDLSHLILSANYYGDGNWHHWYDELIPFTNHLHIADAEGIDGEGIEFGSGELGNIDTILTKNPDRKIIEIWQGHLNYGAGFRTALNYLCCSDHV